MMPPPTRPGFRIILITSEVEGPLSIVDRISALDDVRFGLMLRDSERSLPRLRSMIDQLLTVELPAHITPIVNTTEADPGIPTDWWVHRPFLPGATFEGALPYGTSIHSHSDLETAGSGASYVTLSPLFPTPSKPGGDPLGSQQFGEIVAQTKIPVFALGGIDRLERVIAAREAGAFGVAGIRLGTGDNLSRLKDVVTYLSEPEVVEGAR